MAGASASAQVAARGGDPRSAAAARLARRRRARCLGHRRRRRPRVRRRDRPWSGSAPAPPQAPSGVDQQQRDPELAPRPRASPVSPRLNAGAARAEAASGRGRTRAPDQRRRSRPPGSPGAARSRRSPACSRFIAAHCTTGIAGRKARIVPTWSSRSTASRVSVPPCRACASNSSAWVSSATALTTSRPPGRSAAQPHRARPGAAAPPPTKTASGARQPGQRGRRLAVTHLAPSTAPSASALRPRPRRPVRPRLDRRRRGWPRPRRHHSIADRARAGADIPQQFAGARRQRRQRHRADLALGELAVMLEQGVGQPGGERDHGRARPGRRPRPRAMLSGPTSSRASPLCRRASEPARAGRRALRARAAASRRSRALSAARPARPASRRRRTARAGARRAAERG